MSSFPYRYKCEICEKLFKCGRWLRRHYQKFHSDVIDDVDSMKLSEYKVSASDANPSNVARSETVVVTTTPTDDAAASAMTTYLMLDADGNAMPLSQSDIVSSSVNHILAAEAMTHENHVMMSEGHVVPVEGQVMSADTHLMMSEDQGMTKDEPTVMTLAEHDVTSSSQISAAPPTQEAVTSMPLQVFKVKQVDSGSALGSSHGGTVMMRLVPSASTSEVTKFEQIGYMHPPP